MPTDPRPLVIHVMYRFDTGGLENGVVNLINHMPYGAYRHLVLALTEVTEFKRRILRDDVQFIELNKAPGQGFWLYPRLFKLFRQLRPAVVHSRNLAALEVQLPAWLAQVPARIHGEHGRDVSDLDGNNVVHQKMRRFYKPFVNHYLALSRDLATYLLDKIHIPRERITQVYNGVDTEKFSPAKGTTAKILGCPFDPSLHWIVGTVGRMQTVKDQTLLARAFVAMLEAAPELAMRLRLVMVGDGPLRQDALQILQEGHAAEHAWLPGERADIADIMRGLHCFVLPSLAEGISNTILEAMASALPVVATAVGGNADLVCDGETGRIVPAADALAMSTALLALARAPTRALALGEAGRIRVIQKFSMQAMVSTYQTTYDRQLARAGFTSTGG